PFSKLDLISCRNVMIYMGQLLQKKIMPLFHYALNAGGVLFLGSSETVGSFGDLFVPINKKFKIYSKKPFASPVHFEFAPQFELEEEPRMRPESGRQRVDLRKAAEQILLARYMPSAVLVSQKLDIMQFIGQTGRFLDPTPGDASLNVLKMVKSGLQTELR